MGCLALDAVTLLYSLSPAVVARGVNPARWLDERFFVSRYLLHASQAEMDGILDAFAAGMA